MIAGRLKYCILVFEVSSVVKIHENFVDLPNLYYDIQCLAER